MPELFAENVDILEWLRSYKPYKSQAELRQQLVWALDHEYSLPPGPLKDAATDYSRKIENAIIPRGRV